MKNISKREWLGWFCLWGLVFSMFHSEKSQAAIEIPPYTDMVGKPLSTQMCLAVNAYHEGRSESDVANLMIMAVVEQRVRDTRHKAKTICEAVFHPYAFSWTDDRRSDRIRDKQQYIRLYKLAEKFLRNKDLFVSMAEQSDHYHKAGHKTSWNYRVLTYVGQVDQHVFYRWNK